MGTAAYAPQREPSQPLMPAYSTSLPLLKALFVYLPVLLCHDYYHGPGCQWSLTAPQLSAQQWHLQLQALDSVTPCVCAFVMHADAESLPVPAR